MIKNVTPKTYFNQTVNGKKVSEYRTFKLAETGVTEWVGRVLLRWTNNDVVYLAVRDTEGYITISYVTQGFLCGFGDSGVDYCFLESDILELCKKIECPLPE
jgi:hypothetical protein